jgi:ribonuclease HI
MTIEIYTDGASKGNPGRGGWGCYARFSDTNTQTAYGGELNTTNNAMEMKAVLYAMKALDDYRVPNKTKVIIYSDSMYVINGITNWCHNWIKNGWRTKGGYVKNKKLWEMLYESSINRNLEFIWVKGHNGNKGNETADYLANMGVQHLDTAINMENADPDVLHCFQEFQIKKKKRGV